MCFCLLLCWNSHISFAPRPHSISQSPHSIHSPPESFKAMDVFIKRVLYLLWKTHGGSEVVLLSRWKLTLGLSPTPTHPPTLAPVVSCQSLGRLRARLQSVPAPGSRGPERGWTRRYARDKTSSALHKLSQTGLR